jgi:iron complex outermembrane receptor protein
MRSLRGGIPALLGPGVGLGLGLGLCLGAFSLPLAARAQSAGSDSTQLGTVTVTGSRIKKAESEGTSPVITLSAKDLAASGVASLGDILQQLSVSGSALNTKFNSAGNFGFPANGGGVGSGSTTIGLRSLQANRTLVLVDGLRWVNESSASGVSAAVDLNTIPVSIIERVEILTDGASSLYGSDAIAGVVNIITKKRQDGAAANVYYGDFSTGGGQTYTGDISLGGKSGKLSFFLDLSHYDQHKISSGDWAQSSEVVPGTGLAFGSSATPTGRFIFTTPGGNSFNGLCPDGTCNVTPNGTAATGVPSFPADFHQFSTADRFNFAPYNLLLTPSRRTAIFGQGQYEINDSVRWYLKGLYQKRTSLNQAAPEPIFFGPDGGTGIAATVGIDASNPYNPLGYTLDPASNFALGTRRPLEGGPRLFGQDVDTRYIATGFEGEFKLFEREFSWDVNYASAENDATQDVHGTYNILHIKNALGPVDACNALPGCVPLNIFGGPGTITPEMLNYISFVEHDESTQSLDLVTLNLSGSAVTLPAGSLDFATGYEHRKLKGAYSPDSIVIAGESNGVPSLPTSGEYSVDEWYLELAVPLLARQPLAKRLDLSLATRFSDYSTFGTTWKNKFGLRWQLVNDLTLRGTFAQGFRAPSVGELYGSPARFDAVISDPCSGAGATSPNCVALGVKPGYEQLGGQISVQTGGSSQLRPETSKSTTAGLVYSPSWAERRAWSQRMDLQLTYYKIRVDNAVQAPDAQTTLDRCVASGDPTSAFCSGIHRGGSGTIVLFEDTLQNLGRIDTHGVDLTVSWTAPKYAYGQFSANWQATWVGKYRAVANDTGLPEPDGVGVEVHDSSIPRWRSNLRLSWALDALSASWTLRYISALSEQCGDAAAFAVCDDPNAGTNRLHSVLYDDVQLGWKLPLGTVPLTLTAGVNNLFDASPPQCLSCSLNGYDASAYDLPGRFYYVQAGVKF